jgi:hypothetical protein
MIAKGGLRMSRWTATSIADNIHSFLHGTRLILVSNREPYIHRWHRQALLDPASKDPSAPESVRWNFDWALRFAARV